MGVRKPTRPPPQVDITATKSKTSRYPQNSTNNVINPFPALIISQYYRIRRALPAPPRAPAHVHETGLANRPRGTPARSGTDRYKVATPQSCPGSTSDPPTAASSGLRRAPSETSRHHTVKSELADANASNQRRHALSAWGQSLLRTFVYRIQLSAPNKKRSH